MGVDGKSVRISSDIGGTFTDIVLEIGNQLESAKVLTCHESPAQGVLKGLDIVIERAGIKPGDVDLLIHGTTLATNALIERRGARVALLTTGGFRDTLEIRTESRFEQYDLNIAYPEPLVPRERRFVVPERLDAHGHVVTPLDEQALAVLRPLIAASAPEAIAICFLHSYINPVHEQRARALLCETFQDVPISISCEVAQEMREYSRFSTTCANAYVQPLIASYLSKLSDQLKHRGFTCPLLLMLSNGGLTNVEAAIRFPVRLVESGPAGGAVFASDVARQCGLPDVLSFDMGGTTAKLCLIKDGSPQTAREFEVARVHRFRKGSGIPLRIPVVDLVEIGAGGGSIAKIDALNNVAVGPESAGSDPGPACYALGGVRATVSDANLVLGRLDADNFAGGHMKLDKSAAASALNIDIGDPLNIGSAMAAFGVVEMVEENMISAARVHAIESGRNIDQLVMIAFGGGAPLHAGPMAQKLGISRFIVPGFAGVGSAVGFLRAPVRYDVVRTFAQKISTLNFDIVNSMLAEMDVHARSVVERASLGAPLGERRIAFMRYVGQGHEVSIEIPEGDIAKETLAELVIRFERRYRELFTWLMPHSEIEVVTWSVSVGSHSYNEGATTAARTEARLPLPSRKRKIFDPTLFDYRDVDVYERGALVPGDRISGPSVIVEDETSTYIPSEFIGEIDQRGFIDCRRKS